MAEYFEVELLPLLPPDRGVRIVEIGSGYGHLLRFLAEQGYRNLGAIDSSRALLGGVRQRLGSLLSASCVGDLVETLNLNPRAFDVIIMFDVIEHVPFGRLVAAVQAIHRALRPSGRVILRTPNMANILGVYSRYMDFTHYIGFTEFSLTYLLRQGGFLEPQLYIPRPMGSFSRRLQIRLMRRLQRVLFRWQDRTVPRCFDKNIIMFSEMESSESGLDAATAPSTT